MARTDPHRARLRSLAGTALALAVFVGVLGAHFAELASIGLRTHTPVSPRIYGAPMAAANRADVEFEAWLVMRHARTWVSAPHRLFDTPHCAPAEKTLTLGIPMLTMGVLAIPAALATGDVVLTYNLVLMALPLLAALLMYGLIVSWTGVPAAGIVAGLLYGFQATRLSDIGHPSVWDSAWVLPALWFAERWLSAGRWRDALGLVSAIGLQIGASFYALLAAAFLTTPVGVWLLVRHGPRHAGGAQVAFVVVSVAALAAWLLGPYLMAPASSGMQREAFQFAQPAQYLPGGLLFPGWSLCALALLALALPARFVARQRPGDPRWVLLSGMLALVVVTLGPVYEALAGVVPGLESVRVVRRLSQGLHLGMALLAGLAVAAIVRHAGSRAALAGAALVVVAAFDIVRAPGLGAERRFHWEYEAMAPSAADVAFFGALGRDAPPGAILEVPVERGWSVVRGPARILLSLEHGRRTSACFGSYEPDGRKALAELASRLPDEDAIAELVALGFSSVVVHLPDDAALGGRQLGPLQRFEEAADAGQGVTRLRVSERKVAYALE